MKLTNLQQAGLHRAILAYFAESRFEAAAEAFRSDAAIEPTTDIASATGELTNKWVSLFLLQKKIDALEGENTALRKELDSFRSGKATAAVKPRGVLPRAPAARELRGHRLPLTREPLKPHWMTARIATQLAFHPVYSVLATASADGSARLWDAGSGQLEHTLRGHSGGVTDCCFSPSGEVLATGSEDMSVRLWSVKTALPLRALSGHSQGVTGVAFLGSAAGALLISCASDASIRLWNPETFECMAVWNSLCDRVRRVASDADGRTVAAALQDGNVDIYAVDRGMAGDQLTGHTHVVEDVIWSSADQDTGAAEYIATASRDRTARVWDPRTLQCSAVLSGHENWVRGLAAVPGAPHFLLSVSDDRSMRVWDLRKTAEPLKAALDKTHGGFACHVAASRAVPLVATAGADCIARVWECA